MSYRIVAEGGQTPGGRYELTAETAREALNKLGTTQRLFERARVSVRDERGREVPEADLEQTAREQEASVRSQGRK